MNSVGDGELANKSIHIKLFQANKHESRSNEDRNQLGLPGVRFLTGQSGFLAICPVKNMMLNRTISCPVFGRP